MTKDIPTPTGKARIAKIEDFRQEKTVQFEMFEVLNLPDHQRYSNTIELYDFIPKYSWAKQERINGQFLQPLKREFVCRDVAYNVTITPASLEEKDGVFRNYFPSKREELVEDALRKLATEGNGVMFDDLAGVKFTLYQLQQELKRNGHSYSLDQIKDAIMICAGTHLKVTSRDGSIILVSSMFETVGLQTREQWKGTGNKTSAFVRFNMMVTRSIKSRDYLLYDYEKSMSYTSTIARQLHKRLSHHYRQASVTNSYDIKLTTLIRDLGLNRHQQLRDNLRQVEKALKEMQEKKVILTYRTEKITEPGKRKKLLDAKFCLTPHPQFVSETKHANARQRDIRSVPLRGEMVMPSRPVDKLG